MLFQLSFSGKQYNIKTSKHLMQISNKQYSQSQVVSSPQHKERTSESNSSLFSPNKYKFLQKNQLTPQSSIPTFKANKLNSKATSKSTLYSPGKNNLNKALDQNSSFKVNQSFIDTNVNKTSKLFKLKQSSISSSVDIDIKDFKLPLNFQKTLQISSKSKDKKGKSMSGSKYKMFPTTPSPCTPLVKKSYSKKESLPSLPKWIMMKIRRKSQFFKVIKFLDEGSFGKVYLVVHQITGMIFCMKVIEKEEIKDESLHQLIRQIGIQSHVNHPNIIHLYSFSSDAKFIYLLLEPCLQGNLYAKLKKEPLEQKVAKRYLKEICSALEELHKKDILHRDVKPENILLHEGTAKLCDFGWSVHSPVLRNTKCGTPIYTCPEMVKEEAYDSKIDIWCIGVLTYEVLFGTAPFEIRTPQDFYKILQNEIVFPKKIIISEEASDFMKRCLEKESNKRMRIREVLEHQFLSRK